MIYARLPSCHLSRLSPNPISCHRAASLITPVVQVPSPSLLPSLINSLPSPPLNPQEIEALDNYDGEPWCEVASAAPSTTPGGPQSSLPSSSFSDSPRASRAASMAILPPQATPPHMVARHDIMDVTIHLPVRYCFYLDESSASV